MRRPRRRRGLRCSPGPAAARWRPRRPAPYDTQWLPAAAARDARGVPATGTNVFGALRLACEMCADHAAGSIVTLMCDSGARYMTTYDDDTWLREQGIDIGPYQFVVERAWDDKAWDC